MAVCTADFESGSNGSNVLAADPGSDTAWDSVTVSGGTITYSNTTSAHGSLSAKFDMTSSPLTKKLTWSTAFGTQTDYYIRLYFQYDAWPASPAFVFQSDGLGVRLMDDGRVRVITQAVVAYTTTMQASLDTWYRIEAHIVNSDTVGQVEFKIFEGDSTTEIESHSTGTDQDTGASTTFVDVGVCETTTSPWILYLDDVLVGATSWPGPVTTVQTLLVSADSVDGAWTDQAGGTALAAAIDETTASDSDYIRSEFSPPASGCRVKLAAGGDPLSSSDHQIAWRVGKDSAGGQTVNMTVKLYQGGGNVLGAGTLIATLNRNNVSSTATNYTESLSGAEADSITDYTDLYLEFHASV